MTKPDRRKQVIAFLDRWTADKSGLSVTYPEVYEAIDMRQGDFSTLLQKAPMQEALKAMGWKIVRGRPSKLIRA